MVIAPNKIAGLPARWSTELAFEPDGRQRNAAKEAQAGIDRREALLGRCVGNARPAGWRGCAVARRDIVYSTGGVRSIAV